VIALARGQPLGILWANSATQAKAAAEVITDLSGTVLSSALRRRELPPSLAPLAHVFAVACAHLVVGAGNGWVNGVLLLGTPGMGRVLRYRRRCSRLACTSSEEVFS
jgi:hypothetical protein